MSKNVIRFQAAIDGLAHMGPIDRQGLIKEALRIALERMDKADCKALVEDIEDLQESYWKAMESRHAENRRIHEEKDNAS